jgi:hypothetical protein
MSGAYKLLLVGDDSPEFPAAALYAALRARTLNAQIAILCIAEQGELSHWVTVNEDMRAEALERAEATFARTAAMIRAEAGMDPEKIVRTGELRGELRRILEERPDIHALVLAAGSGREGPGPLVSALAKGGIGGRPVPVVVVPGSLPAEEIRRLAAP